MPSVSALCASAQIVGCSDDVIHILKVQPHTPAAGGILAPGRHAETPPGPVAARAAARLGRRGGGGRARRCGRFPDFPKAPEQPPVALLRPHTPTAYQSRGGAMRQRRLAPRRLALATVRAVAGAGAGCSAPQALCTRVCAAACS